MLIVVLADDSVGHTAVSLRGIPRYSWKYRVVRSMKPEKPAKLKGFSINHRNHRCQPDLLTRESHGLTHRDKAQSGDSAMV